MLRTIALAAGLVLAPFAASAAIYSEPTPNLTPGGIEVVTQPGSAFPADSSIYVGDTFGGGGLAISGVENFEIFLANPAEKFTFLRFEVFEPTKRDLYKGCNTTCTDSTFLIEIFDGGSLLSSISMNFIDDTIHSLSIGGANFDLVRITETIGSNDNEFFGNFYAETILPPVPLPATLPLVLAGLGAFGLIRRRRG